MTEGRRHGSNPPVAPKDGPARAAPVTAPEVTLSFDNGPDPDVTPRVLEILRRRGIAATFFVVGQRLRDAACHALAARAHAEGHWIGNHSFTHQGPLGARRDPGHAAAEIAATEALIGPLAHPDRLFRPVGGGGRLGPHLLSAEAAAHLAAHGHTVVLWSAVPGDWHDPDGWPDRALAQCAATPRPLLVLHDIPGAALAQLDGFLGRLADAGARFRQDFPEDAVVMRRGIPAAGFSACVTAAIERGAPPSGAACPV